MKFFHAKFSTRKTKSERKNKTTSAISKILRNTNVNYKSTEMQITKNTKMQITKTCAFKHATYKNADVNYDVKP